jgi:hypothetical protein
MGKTGTKLRDCLTVEAVDPETGRPMAVMCSHRKLLNCARGNRGQVYEAARLVPIILQHPKAVFRGLKRDADEPVGKKEEGWLCYSGIPPHAYNEDGSERGPWPGEVFLVFVSKEKVVYNWYWDDGDPGNPNLPEGHRERFLEQPI